jgi:large subunit ribosomal protein L9
MAMKVILRSDVADLGHAGDLVNVKDGYARNYLFPRNLAVEASKASIRALEHERRQIALREKKRLGELEAQAQKIRSTSVTIAKEVGENDRLFGSVTSMDIQRALEGEGIAIDRRLIDLDEPIKELGVRDVPIKLHRSVEAKLKVWVVKA